MIWKFMLRKIKVPSSGDNNQMYLWLKITDSKLWKDCVNENEVKPRIVMAKKAINRG